MKLLVVVAAGLVSHLALRSPMSLLDERTSTIFDPLHVLGSIAGWVCVYLLLPRWAFRGTAWLAASIGCLWGLGSVAFYCLLTLLLSSTHGPSSGELVAGGVLLCLGVAILAAPASVPIGIAGALVIRRAEADAVQQADAD